MCSSNQEATPKWFLKCLLLTIILQWDTESKPNSHTRSAFTVPARSLLLVAEMVISQCRQPSLAGSHSQTLVTLNQTLTHTEQPSDAHSKVPRVPLCYLQEQHVGMY